MDNVYVPGKPPFSLIIDYLLLIIVPAPTACNTHNAARTTNKERRLTEIYLKLSRLSTFALLMGL